MGIFHEQVIVVNRAPETLNVRFDGQDINLPPGESAIPKVAVEYAKRQNTIMGSGDPSNPSMSGARYLVGVKGKDECDPLTKEEWESHTGAPCRLDLELLADDRLGPKEHFETKTKGRSKKTQAGNRSEAHAATPSYEPDTV